MSIGHVDIRKDILRLVRKSASTPHDPEKLQEVGDHSEYRIKFLEYRKQFEEPLPPANKEPFFPHWIKPEFNTDLRITYKKRGTQITDVRIDFVHNDYGNNNEIGSRKEPKKPGTTGNVEALPNQDSVVKERGERIDRLFVHNVKVTSIADREEANLLDDNLFGTSDETSERLMEGEYSRPTRSIRRSRSLRINEERSSSFSFGTLAVSGGDRTVDTPNPNTLCSHSMPREPIVCRPIVRKLIELKKYDHIVRNVIGTHVTSIQKVK